MAISETVQLRVEYGTYSTGEKGAQLFVSVVGEFDEFAPEATIREIADYLLTCDINILKQISLDEHPAQADGDSGPTK